jgi:hypothetical protein
MTEIWMIIACVFEGLVKSSRNCRESQLRDQLQERSHNSRSILSQLSECSREPLALQRSESKEILAFDLKNFGFADLKLARAGEDSASIQPGVVGVSAPHFRVIVSFLVTVFTNADLMTATKREKPGPTPEITTGGNDMGRIMERKPPLCDAVWICQSENKAPPVRVLPGSVACRSKPRRVPSEGRETPEH